MVAKTLTFAVFAAHEVIRPAFEAAKDQVADQNHSCFDGFSHNGDKKSPVVVAPEDICPSQILLRSVGTSSRNAQPSSAEART